MMRDSKGKISVSQVVLITASAAARARLLARATDGVEEDVVSIELAPLNRSFQRG